MLTAFVGSNKSGRRPPFRYTSRLAIILGRFAINFLEKIDFRGKLICVPLVGEHFTEKDSDSAHFAIRSGTADIRTGQNDTPIGADTVPGVEVQSKTPDFAVT